MVHAPAAEKRRSRRAGPPTAPSSAPTSSLWSGRRAIRPKLLKPRAPPTPTAASPRPSQVFFPGGQFRHPQKRTANLEGDRSQAAGDWYIVTKDFMIATLKRADKEQGYFMVDSSTWVAEKSGTQSQGPLPGRQAAGQHLPRPGPAGRGHPRGGAGGQVHRLCGLPRASRSSKIMARTGTARGSIMTRPTPASTRNNRGLTCPAGRPWLG